MQICIVKKFHCKKISLTENFIVKQMYTPCVSVWQPIRIGAQISQHKSLKLVYYSLQSRVKNRQKTPTKKEVCYKLNQKNCRNLWKKYYIVSNKMN